MRWVLIVAGLTLVYALALASAKPLDLGTGVLVSVAALLLARKMSTGEAPPDLALPARILRFPRFALAVVAQVLAGTWHVALVVLGLRSHSNAGLVELPIGERSRAGATAAGFTITLTPGEVLVGVDWERRVMLIHAIDATDPDALRAHHRELYERYQRGVFP